MTIFNNHIIVGIILVHLDSKNIKSLLILNRIFNTEGQRIRSLRSNYEERELRTQIFNNWTHLRSEDFGRSYRIANRPQL
jgi:hypothetical protein